MKSRQKIQNICKKEQDSKFLQNEKGAEQVNQFLALGVPGITIRYIREIPIICQPLALKTFEGLLIEKLSFYVNKKNSKLIEVRRTIKDIDSDTIAIT